MDYKNEDNFRNEDDIINKDYLENRDDLKTKDYIKISLGRGVPSTRQATCLALITSLFSLIDLHGLALEYNLGALIPLLFRCDRISRNTLQTGHSLCT